MKYLILSQPKSGTYLASNLLKNLGINQSFIHLSLEKYEDYTNANLGHAKNNPKKYSHKLNLSESVKLVKDGFFAVGHIPYTNETQSILKDFKKIALTRNFEDIVSSWKRFNTETGRNPNLDKNLYNKILNWKNQDSVFHLEFDDIVNYNIKKINELQLFLNNNSELNLKKIIRKSLNQNSLTKSDIRK